MSWPHTRAIGVLQPINILANLINNPHIQGELRNLHIDLAPSPVINKFGRQSDIFMYDIRRQVSPTPSPPASLKNDLNPTQSRVNTSEQNLFHVTFVAVGQMVYTKWTGHQTGRQSIHASTTTYTGPNVVVQSNNDISFPQLGIEELPTRSTPHTSPTRRMVPYTPNRTRTDIEHHWESYQLYKSRVDLDVWTASMLASGKSSEPLIPVSANLPSRSVPLVTSDAQLPPTRLEANWPGTPAVRHNHPSRPETPVGSPTHEDQ